MSLSAKAANKLLESRNQGCMISDYGENNAAVGSEAGWQILTSGYFDMWYPDANLRSSMQKWRKQQ